MFPPMDPSLTVAVVAADGQPFQLSKSAAELSAVIKNPLAEGGSGSVENPIPLPNVTAANLAKIIEYLEMHATPGVSNLELLNFDTNFLDGEEFPDLYAVALAANDLEIDILLDEVSAKIAAVIKNKSMDWLRNAFGIQNDLTREDQARIKTRHLWSFPRSF